VIFRAAVIERDGGVRVELEVLRLAEGAERPAGAALYAIERDRPWSDEEVIAWALTSHRAKMPSPRCGLAVDLRPLAEAEWIAGGQAGWHEAWREALHLVTDQAAGQVDFGYTLCGRLPGTGWYVVGEAAHPRAVAEQLPPWAFAGERRCKRCAASWEIAMLARRQH
jgi:hypothetical protein